jgi:UDP:flavonoid glycosyltransferase YjiC (YdhE family)
MRIAVAADSGPGHLFPFLALARQLRRAGHQVIVYAEPSAAGRVRAAGCEHERMPVDDGAARLGACRTTAQVIRLYDELANRVAPDFLRVISKRKVDLVLTDALCLGAALGAQASGVRWASMATTPMLLSSIIKKSAQALIPTRRLRRLLGLPPTRLSSLAQSIAPRLHLLPWTPEFDLGEPPPQARHIGALNWEPPQRARAPGWLSTLGRRAPAVLVSVSTVPFGFLKDAVNQYVSEAIRVLNELPVEGVITLGNEEYEVTVAPASHVRVVSFVPHGLIFPKLSALVTHGGWGTLSRALTAGVPMVVVPFALDQPSNAELMRSLGVGHALPISELQPERLFSSLKQLLMEDSPERRAAQAMAERWSKFSAARAIASLVRL